MCNDLKWLTPYDLVSSDVYLHITTIQQVAYIPAQLPNSSHSYLEIVSALCALSGDDILSGLVQEEIRKRCNDTPDVLPLLKFYKSSLPANITGYFLR